MTEKFEYFILQQLHFMHLAIPVAFGACGENKFVQHLLGGMVPHVTTVPSLAAAQTMILYTDSTSVEYFSSLPLSTRIPYTHALSSSGTPPSAMNLMRILECGWSSPTFAVMVLVFLQLSILIPSIELHTSCLRTVLHNLLTVHWKCTIHLILSASFILINLQTIMPLKLHLKDSNSNSLIITSISDKYIDISS